MVVFVLDAAEEEDDEEADDEVVVVEDVDEICSVTGGALELNAVEDGVLSVATCSSRSGGRSSAPLAASPMPNNAATAAPRNAPTASRIGAPCWSSTRYLYRPNSPKSSIPAKN
ncbi:MAG: hypothetical protein ABW224_23140 [Kibdelosporangium sp.]